MRPRRFLPLAAAVLAAAPAVLAPPAADAAPGQRATFNVSLYGVQRYEYAFARQQRPEYGSFDERGTIVEHSVARFHTAKPRRATIDVEDGSVSFNWSGDRDGPELPVLADYSNSGEYSMEQATGIVAGGPQWEVMPPPLPAGCTAHTDHQGFNLSLSSSRAEATSGGSVFVPIGNPLEDCPFGDRSLSLYQAKGRISLTAILQGRESELILRGRDSYHEKTETQTTDWKKKTTVYVVFKRIGS